ncbi:hypothetical protein MNBD_NITROSPINAE01-1899 [hydrothermal vent metagenome]|uniref:YCII-related domain-containing protein n=1 Tax=hydrothermal vent metagenome TaxID=652676 RepID=A0A3B1CHV3_9ZZZZ
MRYLAVSRLKENIDFKKFQSVIGAHRSWVADAMEAGVIISAGRWGDIGGIIIFDLPEDDSVENFLANDPLKQNGLVGFEWAEYLAD